MVSEIINNYILNNLVAIKIALAFAALLVIFRGSIVYKLCVLAASIYAALINFSPETLNTALGSNYIYVNYGFFALSGLLSLFAIAKFFKTGIIIAFWAGIFFLAGIQLAPESFANEFSTLKSRLDISSDNVDQFKKTVVGSIMNFNPHG